MLNSAKEGILRVSRCWVSHRSWRDACTWAQRSSTCSWT